MNKTLFLKLSILLAFSLSALTVQANTYNALNNDPFGFFKQSNGWTQFADNDGYTRPDIGGQKFDAEYLFYKYDKTNNDLSIGLQTGYDLVDGHVRYNNKNYYSGDLALSFDGSTSGSNGSGFEYAVDFGLYTQDYYGNAVGNGTDTAGLYKNVDWNNNILNPISNPFAMDDGDLVQAISFTRDDDLYNTQAVMGDNTYGRGFTDGVNNSGPDLSYFRIVTFNLDDIVADSSKFTVDAHWTMSCGNDYINGDFIVAHNDTPPVPEPSVLALFGIGSLSLLVSGVRRRQKK